RAGSLVGHVTCKTKMRLSRNRVEISRRTFCSGAVDIEDCDTGAFRHESPGGRKTYPSRRGRARNNSCFAAKQHAFLPWICFPEAPLSGAGLVGEVNYAVACAPANAQLSSIDEFGSLIECCSLVFRPRRSVPSRRPRAPAHFVMLQTNSI